jgi:succinoglycan exporter
MLSGKRILRSAGWMASSGYINLAISFLGNLALARLLIPEDFGTYALAESTLALIFMIAGFGSQESIVQCRDDSIQKLVPTAFWMTLVLSTALLIVGMSVALVLGPRLQPNVAPLIFVLSWTRLLQNIAAVFRAMLQRGFRFRDLALVSLLSNSLSFAVAIVAARSGMTVWALAIREVVLVGITVVALAWLSGFRLEFAFSRRTAKWVWDFGWRMMVVRINEMLFGRLDNLVVGSRFGTDVLGHYSLAYRLAYLGNQLVQGSIQPVAFSTFSALQKSTEQLRYSFERLNYWLWRTAIPVGVVVLVAGQNLVVLIYGEKWNLAGLVFQALFPFVTLIAVGLSYQEFLIGSGNINSVIRARTAQVLVFIPALLIAGAFYKFFAVVWVVNLSVLLGWLLMAHRAGHVVSIRWLYLLKGPVVAAFLAAAMGLGATQFVTGWTARLALITVTQVIVCGLVYVAVLFLIERQSLLAEWHMVRARLI